jgi:quercetin 2,3-dioxygenase
VKVIAGIVGGVRGPVQDVVADPTFLDVKLEAGRCFELDVPADHSVLAYVIEGAGYLAPDRARLVNVGQLAVLSGGDGVQVTASRSGQRFLLFAGRPLREKVAWYGPIVMNTEAELETAFREYQAGTFVKR